MQSTIKSTKTAYEGGFVIKFFTGKKYHHFFVDRAIRRKQTKSLPNNGASFNTSVYDAVSLKSGTAPVPLTPTEVILAGRLMAKSSTTQKTVKTKKSKKVFEKDQYGIVSDHKLDEFVAKNMMGKRSIESYTQRKNGPGAILVYGHFQNHNVMDQLAHVR